MLETATFDGDTFNQTRDGARLAGGLDRVRALMSDGDWRTLHVIATETAQSEAGASARLRDLRKSRFGGHQVERKYVAHGQWAYRLVL